MQRLTLEEQALVYRIRAKWEEICDGLMQFTGSMRPLLMLEFQGYLDYLKVMEKNITFWEIKKLEIDHKVGPCYLDSRLMELKIDANLEIFIPGKLGEISIDLNYFNSNQKSKPVPRWEAIINDIENDPPNKKGNK